MIMKKRFLLLAVAMLGAVLGGSSRARMFSPEDVEAQAGGKVRDEFHQTYPLSGANGRVSLENINGAVRVAVWDREEVRVDAVKRADTRERLDEAQIKVDADADSISIKTEYPHSSMRRDRDDGERHHNVASVDYTLTVPRGVRLDKINIINGALDIEGAAGFVHASSINGQVTARGLTGETNLSVINGRLEATFDRLDDAKPITLASVNGPVTLTVPSNANIELRASTVHGAINNDFGLPVRRGEYVGSDLAGVIGRGGARVKLSNVNGPISIKRAADGRAASAARNLLSETRGDFDGLVDKQQLERDVEQATREAQREVEQATRETQREVEQAMRESRREIERAARLTAGEQQRIAREAQHAVREAQRDINSAEITRQAVDEARRTIDAQRTVITRDKDLVTRGRSGDEPRRIERETKSFPVSGVPRVRVETFDGPITVRAWDKPEVSYTAVKRAADDQEMRGVRLKATQNDSQITISAEFDKNFSREVVKRDDRMVAFNSGASVELEIYVPRNASLKVSSGDGRLRVEGVSGDIDLHTGDGPIDVSDAGGTLRINTGDGQIRISDFDGTAEARTGDGRITLDGRFGQLNAETGDGSISLAMPADANATIETDAESVVNDGLGTAEGADDSEARTRRWRVGGGGKLIKLRTGDGRIILRAKR